MEQKQRGPTAFSWADFDYIWQGMPRNNPKSTVKISSCSTFIFLGDTGVIPTHIVMLLEKISYKLLRM